jgi:copper chaperone CopZ
MEVLVFKTNLRFKKQINAVTPHINNLHGVTRWNVDLYDKDKVLRIESQDLSPRKVEATLQQAGYYCEELQ